MFLRELFEAKARRVVAVMPGGFHPFHPGHKSLYDWAVKTFGQKNVYVAATNDTATRPFPFEVKKKLAAMAGVPESNFIQVKSPFNNREYAGLLDADTALVFVRSQKDKSEQPLPDQTKKNGEPGYLRSYTGKNLNTADEMGYMAYGPTINFDFSGMQIKSASELRATWPEMSDEDKLKAAKLMYGNGAKVAVELLNQALGDKEAPVGEATIDESKMSFQDMSKNREFAYTFRQYVNGNANKDQVAELVRGRVDSEQFADEVFKQGVKMGGAKGARIKELADHIRKDSNVFDLPGKAFKKIKKFAGIGEDVSPEDEDEFHVELDKLVHKYFGHSSDEKKEKEVDEILGFATKSPKRATRTVKRRPPEEDSVQDKIKKRRALASKVGVSKAFSSDAKDLEKLLKGL